MLPFSIRSELAGPSEVLVTAGTNGADLTIARYRIGSRERRREIARAWSDDPRLTTGESVEATAVELEMEQLELAALQEARTIQAAGPVQSVERVAYVDDQTIVELAWNAQAGVPDYIVCDRRTGEVQRSDCWPTPGGLIRPPAMCLCPGICTPGPGIAGAVLLPTDCDQQEADLSADVASFISRYVELPGDAIQIAVTYVQLSYVFDAFSELPYLAFRTADSGRGKSRALEAVGSICYRPILAGGGSSAAAVLRMLDAIGGTLLADEFDQRADTELAAALNRIINQGFQANRPLIKCDGEDMVPRPYRCFGPKLFALRGQLGDDASESRTISIRMRQRTRKDIPINLPRRQFDEQALQLRNRLLQYRFENLGRLRIDPEQADPRLEDRFNQIGLPLLAVASSEQRRVILTALSSQQEGIAGTRGQTLAGMVLQAALKSGAVSGEARPGEVAQEVNLQRAKADGLEVKDLGRERMSSHKAGRILAHDLELPPAPKDARGAKYRLEPSRVAQLCRRFGVDLPETSQSSLSPQNGPHDPQVNDVSDVCDDSDVSGEPGGGDWQDV